MVRLGVVLTALIAAAAGPMTPARWVAASAYVTVINENGQPVTGLGAEDFAMRDGAVRQGVIGAEPATEPIAAVVVALGAGAASSDVPAVLAAAKVFADRLTRANASHVVSGQSPDTGLPAREPVEAILQACRTLESTATDRRAILVLAARPLQNVSIADSDRLLAAVSRAQAAIWTVEWTPTVAQVDRQAAQADSRQSRPLGDVLADAAAIGGSIRRVVPRVSDLDGAVSRVADLLLSQYLVTFLWPNPMLGQLNITTRHDRGTVLSASWR